MPNLRSIALAANPDAIDAAICIATDVLTDSGARDGSGPQHDAGPCDAIGWIADVCAVHHRTSRLAAECDAGKSEQSADCQACNGR